MIKTILFDFDGTLFDTGEGILRSVQYALEGFGIHETDTARLRKFVGPPLLDSFSELYAMTPEQAQAAVARYRERYLPVGIYGWKHLWHWRRHHHQAAAGCPEDYGGRHDQLSVRLHCACHDRIFGRQKQTE